jgi:PAS domain S-box-containing protein
LEELRHKPLLDTLFDLSPDLLCLLSDNGDFLKVNKYLSHCLGYPEDVFLTKHFLEFVHPDDHRNSIYQWNAVLKNESAFSFKNRYRCATGFYKSLSWNAVQLPDGTIYASARDVSQYVNIQNQLTKAITDNKKIYDNSVDVLCSFNADGQFTKVSKAAIKTWGYEKQELLGKYSFDFIHPDDMLATYKIKEQIKTGNYITNFENRFLHKQGYYVPLIWSAQWLPLEQTMFATARDATEREKQKKQLYQNERRLEALIQSGNDVIGIINPDGIYTYVSPSVTAILGIRPEDFLGKMPFEFIHPDDVERIKGAFEYILTTEDTVHVSPFRVRDDGGNWRWVETFATNMLNDPAIAGIVVNSRDISIKVKDEEEKRLVAEELRRSIERYTLVTEATEDVVWDWNFETNQLSRDPSFEKHFGYTEDLTLANPSPWEMHIHPADKERILKSIHLAIHNPEGKFWKEEYRFIKADGSVAFISDKGYVIRNENKKVIRMVGAMHDNTELKEKELHILKQNQALREISQINSHVIRKPVASILGLMSILDKKAISGTENLEILNYLEITTRELDTVIREINDRSID